MQLEQLHLYGKHHPESGLHKKVIGVSFSEKISVRDPYSKKKDDKEVKPFMVNQSVNLFEKGMIALAPEDDQLKSQIEQYRIKGVSPNGKPVYSDDDEHFVDALNLCVLGFAKHYDSLIRVQLAKKIAGVTGVDHELMNSNTTGATGMTTDRKSEYSESRADSIAKEEEKTIRVSQGSKSKKISFNTSRGSMRGVKHRGRAMF